MKSSATLVICLSVASTIQTLGATVPLGRRTIQRKTKQDKKDKKGKGFNNDNDEEQLSHLLEDAVPLEQFFIDGLETSAKNASNDFLQVDWGDSFATTPAVETLAPITPKPTPSPSTKQPTPLPSPAPTTSNPTSSPVAPVSIGGKIYNDKTNEGVPGIIIQAKPCNTDQSVAIAFSQPDGSYMLRDIGDPGCYYLQYIDTEQHTFVTPANGRSENIILKSGEVSTGWNAGIVIVTSEPTGMPSQGPSNSPTSRPTTMQPRLYPTNKPSQTPSLPPTTSKPTLSPSKGPSSEPTLSPLYPTNSPSVSPSTSEPTSNPSKSPSNEPTISPSVSPSTSEPTLSPSRGPTSRPSLSPVNPTKSPSESPSTNNPSSSPSQKPVTGEPTSGPSLKPSLSPTAKPTSAPSDSPSTDNPTSSPSYEPTPSNPTVSPSMSPLTSEPTSSPSLSPVTSEPTPSPSNSLVTSKPTLSPSQSLVSSGPTNSPSLSPVTSKPTSSPSDSPVTGNPTLNPSSSPTDLPQSTSVAPTTRMPTRDPSSSPSLKPTKKPSSEPSLSSTTSNPTLMPSLKPSTSDPTKTPSKSEPTNYPTDRPVTASPSNSPSVKPTTKSPTSDTPTLVDLVQSVVTTKKPSKKPTSETNIPITFITESPSKSQIVTWTTPSPSAFPVTDSPTGNPTGSPSKQPSNSSKVNWTSEEPMPSTTQTPSRSPLTRFPTVLKEPTQSELNKMKFTLLETQGELSEEAVGNLTLALDAFYNAKLADYYNKGGEYFQAINLTQGEQTATTQSVDEEPVRSLRRRMEEVPGTEIVYGGTIEFVGDAPKTSEIFDVISLVSKEYNDELVSAIVGTENEEFSNVFIVKVEEDLEISDNYLATPDGAQRQPQNLDGPDTAMIIMTVAGVATLTMLLFVFATRSRRGRSDTHQVPEEVLLSPTKRNGDGIQRDLENPGSGEQSIMSSVTDWNLHDENITRNANQVGSLEEDAYEVEPGMRNGNSGGLQSAAALNHVGTKTLGKDDESVMPKTWLNALHGENSSIISPRQGPGDGLESTSSADDTSTEAFSGPTRNNDGAFPTTKYSAANSKGGDWSHIGTVEEDTTHPSVLEIGQAPSQDTAEESKSSLNRFISDLVWLEQKIADENAKESVEVNIKGESLQANAAAGGLQITDSYSYECDEFSPRSFTSGEESTVTSITNGTQAMSIVCRDCYIPPGKLDIEIVSTKDGPTISGIGDASLGGHLNIGDLIMALDDRDTRSMKAEDLAAKLSSLSSCQRKLTLLQFGGIQK